MAEIPASTEQCCCCVAEASETILSLGKNISERAAMILNHFVTVADSCVSVMRHVEARMPDSAAVSRLLKTVADNSATIRERHKKVERHTADISFLCLSAAPAGEVN